MGKNDGPKYIILSEYIKNDIQEGKIKRGDRLPSENNLAEKFCMSRHTVRKAFAILENEGYITAEHGRGRFCTLKLKGRSQTKTIATVTTYISDYIFPRVINGIYDEMTKNGYNILLKNTGNSISAEKKCLEDILEAGIDGLIIEPSKSQIFCRNAELYNRLDEAGIPYVFIQGYYPQMKNKPHILMDDEQGGYLVARHLIELGHRKIVGIFKADDSQGAERHKGFVKGLNEFGMQYNPELIIWYHTEDRKYKPASILKGLLDENKDITAVACYNDQIAMQVIKELDKMGLSVPDDISVTGFDDSAIAKEVGLTTVTHPKDELGKKSAEVLIKLMNGEKVQEHEIMKTELVVRRSTRKI